MRAERSALPVGLGSPEEPICLLSGMSQSRLAQQEASPGSHSSRGHGTVCLRPGPGAGGIKAAGAPVPWVCA